MRLSHALAFGRTEVITHRSREYLALFDLATYSPFVDAHADHLDLEVHLMHQRETLVGMSWTVPDRPIQLDFLLASGRQPLEDLFRPGEQVELDGWIRTLTGRLSLSSAERLQAAARDPALLPNQRVPGTSRARTLLVPPGLYAVHLTRIHLEERAPEVAHQTVLLRHYPFPAPRVAPVRLSGGFW